MRYLQVRDWAKFQHYSKRSPPWIKLHNTVLENPEFAALPDPGKAHLMLIWLLASRTGNRVPDDPEFVGNRINARNKVDLEILISSGFLEVQSDSNAPALRRSRGITRVCSRRMTHGGMTKMAVLPCAKPQADPFVGSPR